ncbi:hypothetical protein [Fusobacterium pseudoperiodonticum]|jgi:hypothetical protein|uniref:hypothetical protein n=1 Tax=Fusobacterium pseudoperiodonticum TaxID=2663009 RepID=UPI0028D826E4|nr:hypothetical protein [Fusobacterium pseudoperiodonticum]
MENNIEIKFEKTEDIVKKIEEVKELLEEIKEEGKNKNFRTLQDELAWLRGKVHYYYDFSLEKETEIYDRDIIITILGAISILEALIIFFLIWRIM